MIMNSDFKYSIALSFLIYYSQYLLSLVLIWYHLNKNLRYSENPKQINFHLDKILFKDHYFQFWIFTWDKNKSNSNSENSVNINVILQIMKKESEFI